MYMPYNGASMSARDVVIEMKGPNCIIAMLSWQKCNVKTAKK